MNQLNRIATILLIFFCSNAFGQDLKQYKLVWSDDFKTGVLDSTIWQYRALGKRRAAVNDKKSISLSSADGLLQIKTFKQGNEVYTGMISTVKDLDQKFGYYECKFRVGGLFRGYWPAFWLQSRDFGKTLDPQKDGMEIDIMEFYSGNPEQYENALHWNGYAENHKALSQKTRIKSIVDNKFHVAGLEWTPEYYKFYLDGKLVWEVFEPISHKEQYIILSTEVESVEPFDKIGKDNPILFEVDYVKVYQKRDKRKSFFRRIFGG